MVAAPTVSREEQQRLQSCASPTQSADAEWLRKAYTPDAGFTDSMKPALEPLQGVFKAENSPVRCSRCCLSSYGIKTFTLPWNSSKYLLHPSATCSVKLSPATRFHCLPLLLTKTISTFAPPLCLPHLPRTAFTALETRSDSQPITIISRSELQQKQVCSAVSRRSSRSGTQTL